MKNILFIVCACSFPFCLKAMNADTAFPRLSIKDKAEIFKAMVNKDCRFTNRIKAGKVYQRITWYADSIVNRSYKMMTDYAKNITELVIDFVDRDSASSYAEIKHLFLFDKRDNYFEVIVDVAGMFPELNDLKFEKFTIPEKINLFLGASGYQAKYIIDTPRKTIVFSGIGRYKSYIDNYAAFGFAYILRNRMNEFNTLVFNYVDDDTGEVIERHYMLVDNNGKVQVDELRGRQQSDKL
jgi:hypothetical protein